jgi:uncharacterized protein YegJ (DUF2314 family)
MYRLAHVSHWALAVAVLWAGIASQAGADTPEGGQIQGNHAVDPKPYQVPNEHAAMQEAVAKARKTVRQFIVALQHPSPGESDFEVKKPFVEKGNVEHIWLSDVTFVGGRFQGKVDNEPVNIRGLKPGQVVSVNPDEISDWVYIKNGKLVGGYTIRAHYNELTPQEKQEFNRSADFQME